MMAHKLTLILFILCFVLLASAAVPKNIFGQRARTITKLTSRFEAMKSAYDQEDVLDLLKALEDFEDTNAEMTSLCHKDLPVVRDLACIDKSRLDRNVARFYVDVKEFLLDDIEWKHTQMIQYLSDLSEQYVKIENTIKQAEKHIKSPREKIHDAIVETVMEQIQDVIPEMEISLNLAIKEASSYTDGLYIFRQVAVLRSWEVERFHSIETVFLDGVVKLRQLQTRLGQIRIHLMATLADLEAIHYR